MHYNKRANTNLFSNADRIKYHQQYNEKGERYLAQNKFYGTFVCEVAFPSFSVYIIEVLRQNIMTFAQWKKKMPF